MKTLADAISRIVLEVHPARIDAICARLTTLRNGTAEATIKDCLGSGFSRHLINQLGIALSEHAQVTAGEICAMFRAATATAALTENAPSVELVWTGPATGLVPTRHTEQVLIDLIDQARERLFLVSFVAFHVKSIISALHRALERGVDVRVLVERAKEDGGNLNIDSVGMLKRNLPQSLFYEWQKGGTDNETYSAVHAKCAVADATTAFVTSANLSEAAMERNMELGVLIRGGQIPPLLERHLAALITTRQLRQL